MRSFGNVTVMVTDAKAPKAENVCSFAFTGWYTKETDGPVWWRWSAGGGEIHIATSKPLEALMTGEVSSGDPPNSVRVLVNAENEVVIENDSKAPVSIESVPLHLRAGENVIRFVSRNQGIKIPTGDRVLAIAIGNLQIYAVSGGACLLKP